MNKSVLLTLTVLAANIVFAQESLPRGITPVNGEITVRYIPTFKSRCTQKTYTKKKGDLFGNNETQIATYGVFEEVSGIVKLSMDIDLDAKFITVTGILNEDASGIESKGFDIQLNPPMAAEYKEFEEFKESPKGKEVVLFMANMMEMGLGMGRGTPLRQGSLVPYEVCGIIPGFLKQTQPDHLIVLGTAAIRGRESVIIGGEHNCSMPDRRINLSPMKAWYAVDLQSGLPAAHSSSMTMSGPGFSGTSTVNNECVITGGPTKAPRVTSPGPSAPKSVEQRLTELKSLLEKGLITQEQFEQKRAEIVKNL